MVKKVRKYPVIGSNALIEFIGHVKDVPAKVDTGADSSSVWATDISVTKEGELHFKLFGEGSPYYTGEVLKRTAYKVASVRSSSGHSQIRYRTEIPVRIKGKRIRILFNLSDRTTHHFPVLIGRRTLANKFLVNVSRRELPPKAGEITKSLNEEMRLDPHSFYEKHYKNQGK